MSKLPNVSGRKAIKAFEACGFMVARINGSHHVMKKEGHPLRLTIPVHGNDSLKTGTLRGLIRDSGLSVDEFSSHL